MNILVTGGAGFIGSHIADLLIKNSYGVTIVDNLSNGNIKNINPKARFYQIDILDKLDKIFKKEKFDAVIHNAALIDANKSKLKPELYKKINVDGTKNFLEYCRKFDIKKIIYASSCAVYGNPIYLPCDEKHPKNPINPYGENKLEAENMLMDYSNKYGFNYIIFRYANVYGPRQSLNIGVMARFIGMAIANKSPVIYGDGNQTRDFVFVEDAAQANVLALKAKRGIFNIGSSNPTSINDLWEGIQKAVNEKIKVMHSEPLEEIKSIYLDVSLAKKILKWSPKTALREGIKKTYLSFSS